MKSLILAILFIFLSVSVAYADNPDVFENQLRRANNQKRIEYYRGVYDTCLYAGYLGNVPMEKSIKNCLEFTDLARKSKWFEQDSPGWQWPIDRTGLISG
jgi:hypothetical protein